MNKLFGLKFFREDGLFSTTDPIKPQDLTIFNRFLPISEILKPQYYFYLNYLNNSKHIYDCGTQKIITNYKYQNNDHYISYDSQYWFVYAEGELLFNNNSMDLIITELHSNNKLHKIEDVLEEIHKHYHHFTCQYNQTETKNAIHFRKQVINQINNGNIISAFNI